MDYLKRIVVFIKSFFQKKTTADDDVEIGKESFVLQLIGTAHNNQTIYELHSKAYLLLENNPKILNDLEWVPGKCGPISKTINGILKNPIFLDGCWEIVPRTDKIMSVVKLTRKGKDEFNSSEYGNETALTIHNEMKRMHKWYSTMPLDIFTSEVMERFEHMCTESQEVQNGRN